MMLSWAGTFTVSCLVPSGIPRGFSVKSPGYKEPPDSLKAKIEADSHDMSRE